MKTPSATILVLVLASLLLGLAIAPRLGSEVPRTAADLAEFSGVLAELAARVNSATVFLAVDRVAGRDEDDQRGPIGELRDRFDGERPERRRQTGSGFVIDATKGHVVTNHHVVGGKDSRVRVTLSDGREIYGDVVGTDFYTDLAVVKIRPGFARREITWGDSDALKPGNLLMAVGSPLDLENSTSWGILSGKSRQVPGLPTGQYQDYLQSDLFIDRGSSGGPLVNMAGDVVGVNTAIQGFSWQGISYSVPSNLARYVAQELIEHGRVRRGFLGVDLGEVTSTYARQIGLNRPYGARVDEVMGGPAEDAGLLKDDVILSVNGTEILGIQNLRARISAMAPGSVAVLRIWRKGSPTTVRVVLGENQDI